MGDLQNWGPWPGVIVKRENDPEGSDTAFEVGDLAGRITASIPGLTEECAWAFPIGWGGSAKFGVNMVPPIGADVLIFFPLGQIDSPRWISAHHGPSEVFPEFVHPDMIVMGTERFRFVMDQRAGWAAFRVIEEVDGVETVMCEDLWNINERGRRIYSKTALVAETDGQLNLDSGGDTQIKGRKIMPNPKPIS